MTKPLNKIKAAMLAPEAGVAEPKRAKSSSFAAQVLDLEVCETASRAMTMDHEHRSVAFVLAALPAEREKLRNNVSPAVRRAKEKIDGADYKVEIADVLTGSTLFLVALVTRVA